MQLFQNISTRVLAMDTNLAIVIFPDGSVAGIGRTGGQAGFEGIVVIYAENMVFAREVSRVPPHQFCANLILLRPRSTASPLKTGRIQPHMLATGRNSYSQIVHLSLMPG